MDSFFSLFDPSDGKSKGYDDNQNDILCSLPPEPQLGNVEYKLKIVNPTKQRFEHLVTQLKWRLREGNGEAIYAIGVEDNGALAGLSETDMTASLQTLKRMASRLGATTTLIREKLLNNQYKIAEVLVRKVPEDQNHIEIRLAVLGNADAGKSTLLGVLTQGLLDNGRGRARLNMFRHLHEIQSGRTSSISHEILGFNSEGQPINYSSSELITSQYICDSSRKLITFMDLAGHKKYLRTTIQGLSGYSPHYAMLVISSAAGAVGMAKEHLSIAVALNVPFFIVITKLDLASPAKTLQTLESFLKQVGSQRVPLIINNIDDVITAGTKFADNVVPIFCASNVTGQGLEELTKFLYLLPPAIGTTEKERLEKESPEFHIDEHFRAGDVGQVLGGLLTKGVISEGTKMQIGPMKDGSFEFVCIKSIHRNRVPCRIVRAGESASICLDRPTPSLRNGMVLVSHAGNPRGCLYFQANVSILSHKTALYPSAQATVHIGNIRQTVVIVGMFSNDALTTNKHDSVLFRFLNNPEYVVVGQRFLVRDGAGNGIGTVTQVFPLNTSNLSLKF